MTVLVVTGIAREAKIASGPGVRSVCSGGSPERLRTLLAQQDSTGLKAVVSFGVAGGLNPALKPGHIVVADAVISDQGRWTANAEIADALVAQLHATHGLRVLRASIAGVDQALIHPEAKTIARDGTGAAAVDMESHIAAEHAAGLGLPFAAIRVVCDPAGRGLPPLVNEALKPDGSVSIRGVFGSLRRQPGQVGDLVRLARDSRTAFRALTRVGTTWQSSFA